MTTIQQLLIKSEAALDKAKIGYEEEAIKVEIKLSQAISLLAIARCLNHIVDWGVGPAPLRMLSDEERENLRK